MDNMTTTASLRNLPPEIVSQVTTFLPQSDLKNLRFVDRTLAVVVARQLFRSTRLVARAKDNYDPQRFIHLANSELSRFVREISCDFSNIEHNGYIYTENKRLGFLPVFWGALPLLARFRNLRTLHLCFDSGFTKRDFYEDPTRSRHRFLVAVFRILAGTWLEDPQETPNDLTMDHDTGTSSQYAMQSPILLSALIVSNLEDWHNPYLTNMPEFKTVMSGIQALRLDITQRKEYIPAARVATTAGVNQCQEMFAQLPQTWLSSPIAANLQVLSLHYQSYWGCFPSVDFRLIGGEHGLPNIRSLSLGRFVFSNEWEVGWITSLNLEELLLEGCAVLARSVHYPTTKKGFGTHSNESPATKIFGDEMREKPLRWHNIFFRIRNSMHTLKRFVFVNKPGRSGLKRQFVKSKVDDPGSRELGLSLSGLITRYSDLWNENATPYLFDHYAKMFCHYTSTTSPKLTLRSDITPEDFHTCWWSFALCIDYVFHHPTYWEEARYKRINKYPEESREFRGIRQHDQSQALMLHVMLDAKKLGHLTVSDKLKVAPDMEFQGCLGEHSLRTLFTEDHESYRSYEFRWHLRASPPRKLPPSSMQE